MRREMIMRLFRLIVVLVYNAHFKSDISFVNHEKSILK